MRGTFFNGISSGDRAPPRYINPSAIKPTRLFFFFFFSPSPSPSSSSCSRQIRETRNKFRVYLRVWEPDRISRPIFSSVSLSLSLFSILPLRFVHRSDKSWRSKFLFLFPGFFFFFLRTLVRILLIGHLLLLGRERNGLFVE